MRKSLTPQEARLWLELRQLRRRGFHFRRQVPFRGYHLDFACLKSRLVVELDGGGHSVEDQAEHDRVRDKVLRREGFATLRITNGDINTNMAGALETILSALGALPPSPEVGRVETKRSEVRGGEVGHALSVAGSAHFPTPLAARVDPPHKGEGRS